MTNNENQMREFWIEPWSFNRCERNDLWGDKSQGVCTVHYVIPENTEQKPIHVIEFAAYEQLRAENLRLLKLLDARVSNHTMVHNVLLKQYIGQTDEITKLKADLDIAVEALTKIYEYADPEHYIAPQAVWASAALSKLKNECV